MALEAFGADNRRLFAEILKEATAVDAVTASAIGAKQ